MSVQNSTGGARIYKLRVGAESLEYKGFSFIGTDADGDGFDILRDELYTDLTEFTVANSQLSRLHELLRIDETTYPGSCLEFLWDLLEDEEVRQILPALWKAMDRQYGQVAAAAKERSPCQ
jgi:hypothetical protein